MPTLDLPALRQAITQNRYLITTHAKARMGLRQVTDDDVKHVIVTGDLITVHWYDPSVWVDPWTRRKG